MSQTASDIQIECVPRLRRIPADAWDALDRRGNPFLSHAFLSGLEEHDCLAPHGWQPCHLVAREQGQIIAALPLYERDNSFGEFVFDWNWADAHEQAIGPYYPKLVSAVPFTPVTGPRLLLHPQSSRAVPASNLLVHRALEQAAATGLSSLHILFPDESQADFFDRAGLLQRLGCQYHWYNDNYGGFDDFLDRLTSKRRKEIRRERRSVKASGLEIAVLQGHEIGAADWHAFYDFYCSTFARKWGVPRLTLDFLRHLGASSTCQPLLFMARDGDDYVAGALALQGDDTLYGRHWGCRAGYRHLHFELCYYQTIDFCISRGLRHLDAGAQGEHKLSRGFVPVQTRSHHWLREPGFRSAVNDFLERESTLMRQYIMDMEQHTAYKRD